MTIWNLGSINLDWSYRVPAFPADGETLAARACTRGLGGKGANQSVAAVRAGSRVVHLGAVGEDGIWARDLLGGFGVDVSGVAVVERAPTGHALILVADGGENRIVLYPGTNMMIDEAAAAAALAPARPGDTLLLQNETNGQAAAIRAARAAGLRVVYSAAPFDAEAAVALMPEIDTLVLNEVEARQLSEALGRPLTDLPVPELLVTAGAGGATWRDLRAGQEIHAPAPAVAPVDTTGAGDVFIGFFAAGRDRGYPVGRALPFSVGAAALHVTRFGTAEATPDIVEVKTFLSAIDPG
jgi:ribokinase